MTSALVGYYNYLFYELADPRTKGWLLEEPWMPVIAITLYLFLIYYWLPKYMEHRKPYKLKRIIQLYNIFQICSCLYLAHWGFTTESRQCGYGCYPTDYSNTPKALTTLFFSWFTLMLKYVDLIETTFFVLRKKYEQVSTLHVYHHVTTLLIVWGIAKYTAGGLAAIAAVLNAFVHVIMYSYYFLAATGPKMQAKLAKVKPVLTILQITQLFMILGAGVIALTPGCEVSVLVAWLYIPNIIVFIVMFINFYLKTYVNKPKSKLL